ncbi:hypothetical protein RB623_18980 [Mesorhizobium sp. LHD-90]|uniref:hypothetical protein n=1 Tax=Mesorhizobium sp. LHD-90 TaxID=3071414 RepID=UPI0027E1F5D3|nr:hypothetical protein [Mesorhizobium sp. LHD-90]MDQ6436147.1 hypothetical protein [Mesorhizobium sp. LHD-90]
MRGFDFSSWQTILTSIAGLLLVTLIGMGIRLVMMMTLQQRRERQNRQINERLKALISAYKVLGGSFTGTLTVSPLHLRDLKRAETEGAEAPGGGAERARRVRDAVEAALSDIVLFGTQAQVELAAGAMRDMAAGRPVEVHALVVSLRNYIREVLDLEAIPQSVVIPNQGPARPSGASSRGGREGGGGRGGGGGGGMGGGMMLGGMGLGSDPDPADKG